MRVAADPAAVSYLDRNISFDGQLSVPVLTMHTTGDGLVISPNEGAYANGVNAAGKGALLRQTFVHRAGHCAFTEAETVAALQVLLERLDTGHCAHAPLQPPPLHPHALAHRPPDNPFL